MTVVALSEFITLLIFTVELWSARKMSCRNIYFLEFGTYSAMGKGCSYSNLSNPQIYKKISIIQAAAKSTFAKEGNLFSQAAKTITTEHHEKKLISPYYFLKLRIPQYDI